LFPVAAGFLVIKLDRLIGWAWVVADESNDKGSALRDFLRVLNEWVHDKEIRRDLMLFVLGLSALLSVSSFPPGSLFSWLVCSGLAGTTGFAVVRRYLNHRDPP
jgi:hypothetical protein